MKEKKDWEEKQFVDEGKVRNEQEGKKRMKDIEKM